MNDRIAFGLKENIPSVRRLTGILTLKMKSRNHIFTAFHIFSQITALYTDQIRQFSVQIVLFKISILLFSFLFYPARIIKDGEMI